MYPVAVTAPAVKAVSVVSLPWIGAKPLSSASELEALSSSASTRGSWM